MKISCAFRAKKRKLFDMISRLTSKIAWKRVQSRQEIIKIQRKKGEVPRIHETNYWQSTWGQLLGKLADIDGVALPCTYRTV